MGSPTGSSSRRGRLVAAPVPGFSSAAFLDPRPGPPTIGRRARTTRMRTRPSRPRTAAYGHAAARLPEPALRPATSPTSRLGALLAPLFAKTRSHADRSVRNLRKPVHGRAPPRRRLRPGGLPRGDAAGGWDVQGIEPDPGAAPVAAARGIPVVTEPFEDAELDPASFDAVTMNHVIEHFHDLLEALRIVRRLLRPGGVLSGSRRRTSPRAATCCLDATGSGSIHRDTWCCSRGRRARRALAGAGFEPAAYASDYSAQLFHGAPRSRPVE